MSLINQQGFWQRHYVTQQSLSALAELELKFPQAAEMAKSFKIHVNKAEYALIERESLQDLFSRVFSPSDLTPEEEAENQAWRDFVKGVCAIAGQAFYASRDIADSSRRESQESAILRRHGDYIIHNIIGPYWKSFERTGRFWVYDDRLRDLIQEIVDQQSNLEAEALPTTENLDA